MLNIIVNSSNNVDVDENRKAEISSVIEHRLGRFSDRLSRIEAYIDDETGREDAVPDKRCMLEARPEGMQPLTVTEHGATVDEAVKSATHKLERMVGDAFGRLEAVHSRADREST